MAAPARARPDAGDAPAPAPAPGAAEPPPATEGATAAAAAAGNDTTGPDQKQPQEQAEPQELDWWQTAVIYQIYPRSFKDSNGDGIGDLNGITEKVDFLKELGVDAVWLSPIFKSPMVDFGYDISDFTDVDPVFGTLQDFDRLLEKLHSVDIRLLLDFVPNHSSDRHPWFEQSVRRVQPYADYYVWADGRPDPRNPKRRLPPNNWLSVFGGPAWTWHPVRGQFYLHQFAAAQPDLNYTNPSVTKDMEAVLQFWLERGVDGFRVDAVPYLVEDELLRDEEPAPGAEAEGVLPGEHASLAHTRTQHLPATRALLAAWRARLDAHSRTDGRTRLMMVEAYGEREQVMRYFGDSAAPGAHFPFNFALLAANNATTSHDLRDAVDQWMDNMPPGGWPNWLLGNHDQPRVATRVGPELADAMNMLSLLLPGTAVVYMGEELGMEDGPVAWEQTVDPPGRNAGPQRFAKFSRDPERTPFQWDDSANAGFAPAGVRPWLPVAPSYRTVNAEIQARFPVSHLQVFRRLVKLRGSPVAQRGALNLQTPSASLLAFARELAGVETLLVVINLAPEDAMADLVTSFGGELPEFLSVVIPSINSGLRIGQQVLSKEVKLPSKASVVLSTKKP
ncbi:hypothetical protein R5R35_003367 [Gryllus longicercus]|uniref:alpha-glucosidase n=1 Tax=Gryllus longicercus TaxID=2509291 RepID=A0AAN9VQR6_9ORTH